MSASFDLPEVEWATLGTVGEPGRRTFYLQARQDATLVTLKLEKQQVAALAELLGELLADRPSAPADATLRAELESPVLADWTVGNMQLAFDESAERIVLIAEELVGDAEEAAGAGAAVGRLAVTPAQAAHMAARGADLVTAGRPACPLCGYPMDPAGHSCPRTNGHRPPDL